jgi:hypothetical protein
MLAVKSATQTCRLSDEAKHEDIGRLPNVSSAYIIGVSGLQGRFAESLHLSSLRHDLLRSYSHTVMGF